MCTKKKSWMQETLNLLNCVDGLFDAIWHFWTLKKYFLIIWESPITCPLTLSSVTKTTATATAPPPANCPNMHSRIIEWGDSGLVVIIFSFFLQCFKPICYAQENLVSLDIYILFHLQLHISHTFNIIWPWSSHLISCTNQN